jgi:hypothetical protein
VFNEFAIMAATLPPRNPGYFNRIAISGEISGRDAAQKTRLVFQVRHHPTARLRTDPTYLFAVSFLLSPVLLLQEAAPCRETHMETTVTSERVELVHDWASALRCTDESVRRLHRQGKLPRPITRRPLRWPAGSVRRFVSMPAVDMTNETT